VLDRLLSHQSIKAFAMVTVILLSGRGLHQRQAGHLEFDAIPLEAGEFRCFPAEVITVEQTLEIADELAAGNVLGSVGELEWRKL
jgi:hypothetical protein